MTTDDHSPPQTSEPLGEEETVANTRNISSGHDVRMKAIEEARVLLEEARQQIEEVGQRKAVGRSRSIPVSRVNNNSPRNKMNRNSPQNNVGSPPHNMDIEMDRLVESDKILRARLESQAKTLSEWKSQNEVYSSELKELKQQYEIAREKITAYEKRMSENDEQRFKTGEELKERTEEKEKYRLEALGALKTLQVEGGQLKTVREAFELAEKKLAQSDEYIAATELEKKIFMERYEEKLKSLEAEKATLKADCEEKYKEKLKCLEAENATLEADCEKKRILIEEHVKRGKELGHEIEAQKDKTAQLDSLVASAESRWLSVSKTNRLLHNKVIEMLGNIRVVCRVRPFSNSEIQRPSHAEDAELIDYQEDGEGIYEGIVVKPADKKQQKFNFDRVFQPDSKQEEVFEEIGPLIQSCMDGYSVCIFAYGQTGSGKTYTMEGGHGNALERGLNYRALELLFRLRDNRREVGETFEFYVTMIEIYNEVIRDLLGSDDDNNDPWNPQKKLEIRKTIKGSSVLGVKEMKVASPEEVAALLDLGNSNRSVGSHSMNHESSRSHSIFCIRIEGRKSDGAAIYAKLHLVDLAGSERILKTDAKGDRLLEAQHINKSLSSLGDVISALVVKKDKEMHVPFRNSKLTYLLQECLGGDSKVMMIVTISPSVYNTSESLSSLNFAKRCRMAELGQTKKQQDSQETVKLKRQINRHSVENKQLLAETQKAATLQEQLQNLQEDYFQQSDAYSKLQLAQKNEKTSEYTRVEIAELQAEIVRQKMEVRRLTQRLDDPSVGLDAQGIGDTCTHTSASVAKPRLPRSIRIDNSTLSSPMSSPTKRQSPQNGLNLKDDSCHVSDSSPDWNEVSDDSSTSQLRSASRNRPLSTTRGYRSVGLPMKPGTINSPSRLTSGRVGRTPLSARRRTTSVGTTPKPPSSRLRAPRRTNPSPELNRSLSSGPLPRSSSTISKSPSVGSLTPRSRESSSESIGRSRAGSRDRGWR